MAFIKNETLKAEAILTREGRKKLVETGWLDIAYFKVSDADIDYNLYDTGSISGSSFYGQEIEHMPIRQPNRKIDYDLLYPNTCSLSSSYNPYA